MQMDNGGEHGGKVEPATKTDETENGETAGENKEPSTTEVND